jgi:hypothetical protein
MTNRTKIPSSKALSSKLSDIFLHIFSFLNTFIPQFHVYKYAVILLILSFSIFKNADAQVCGTSGIDGPQNAIPPVNTYFPLGSTATLGSGSKSITLLSVPPNDPNYNLSYGVTPIKS